MPSAALPIPDADAYVKYASVTGTGPLPVPFPLPVDWQGTLKCAVDGEQLAEGQFLLSPDTAVVGGFPTGEVTHLSAVTAAQVELWRDTPISRDADYGQGPLDLDAFNTELARLTMQVQDARLRAQLEALPQLGSLTVVTANGGS